MELVHEAHLTESGVRTQRQKSDPITPSFSAEVTDRFCSRPASAGLQDLQLEHLKETSRHTGALFSEALWGSRRSEAGCQTSDRRFKADFQSSARRAANTPTGLHESTSS